MLQGSYNHTFSLAPGTAFLSVPAHETLLAGIHQAGVLLDVWGISKKVLMSNHQLIITYGDINDKPCELQPPCYFF